MDYSVVDLKALSNGSTISGGLCYIVSYRKCAYSNGTKFFTSGTFMHRGVFMEFKIWDAEITDIFDKNDVSGQIVAITGAVKDYKGVLEITVQSVKFDHGETNKALFFKSIDVEKRFGEFAEFVNTNMSQKAVALMLGIFKNESLFERFKEEFAGAKMHDAQIGGLLNHTYKMLCYAKTLATVDERIGGSQKRKDCLYMGIAFHDIGKVKEMTQGVYAKNSFVTHIMFGIEMLSKYKEQIVAEYDEEFYYMLQSIILGHHGEFGDKPRTAIAYTVHLIDMLDSQVTSMLDKVETNDFKVAASGEKTIFVRDGYIAVMSDALSSEQ